MFKIWILLTATPFLVSCQVAKKSLMPASAQPKNGKIHFRQIKSLQTDVKRFKGIAISPDGKFLAVSSTGTGVNLFRIGIWNKHQHLEPRDDLVSLSTDMAFSSDSKLLYIATGKALRVWDVEKGKNIRSSAEGNVFKEVLPIWNVAVSKDGQKVVVGAGKQVVVLNAKNLKTEKKVVATDFVTAVSLSHNSQLLAVGCADGAVILWDMRTWTKTFLHPATVNLPSVSAGRRTSLDFSPSRDSLVFATYKGGVSVWNRGAGGKIIARTGYVDTLTFSDDGSYVLLGDRQGNVLLNAVSPQSAPKKIFKAPTNIASVRSSREDTVAIAVRGGEVIVGKLEMR